MIDPCNATPVADRSKGVNLKGVNMDDLQLKQVPVAKTGMLIRRPVADVFAAFIDPDITNKFWFSKGDARLQVGKQVKWEWEMYGTSTRVIAKIIEPNKRIVIEWD